MDDPVDLIDRIDESYTGSDRDSRWARFLLECCHLIRPLMPRYALRAFEVARRYWSGEATRSELEAARIECWEQLKAIGADTKTDDPIVCSVRAVICLLYPDWATDNERVDHLQWFVQIANKAENHRREQLQLLATIFPDAAI